MIVEIITMDIGKIILIMDLVYFTKKEYCLKDTLRMTISLDMVLRL